MMTLDKLKLAALSEEFSDEEVKKAFLDLEINSEMELGEAVHIIQKYRYQIHDEICAELRRMP